MFKKLYLNKNLRDTLVQNVKLFFDEVAIPLDAVGEAECQFFAISN